jgi:DNA-binding protein H-NS
MPKKAWDLSRLSLDELTALGARLATTLRAKVADERDALERRLQVLADLPLVGGLKRRRGRPAKNGAVNGKSRRRHPLKGRKAPIKFRGPNGETWSGRGLAPRWLTELESKGKKRDSYRV